MRIGMISTPYVPVPPLRYGGIELIVDELVQGLVARGHEVVLYTTGAPAVGAPSGNSIETRRNPHLRSLYDVPVWPPEPHHEGNHSAWAIADLLASSTPVDVIHTHCSTTLPLGRFVDIPIVYTNNKRAILAIEKGTPGARAFEEAFRAWGN